MEKLIEQENEIKKQEQMLAQVLQGWKDGIIVTDEDVIIQAVNDELLRMYGFAREELVCVIDSVSYVKIYCHLSCIFFCLSPPSSSTCLCDRFFLSIFLSVEKPSCFRFQFDQENDWLDLCFSFLTFFTHSLDFPCFKCTNVYSLGWQY